MRDRSTDEGFQLMEVPQSPRLTPGDQRLGAVGSGAGMRPARAWVRFVRRGPGDGRRAIALLILLISSCAALIYAGSLALDSSVRWLHQQSEYQYEFREIELVPPPPPWFLGGRARFLDRVRQDANEAERIPLLDLYSSDRTAAPERVTEVKDASAGRLELAFRKFPWVRRVRRVLYSSKKVSVELEYFTPVATLEVDQRIEGVLDESGRVLPGGDVDAKRRSLIRIVAKEPIAHGEARSGLVWKSADAAKDRKILDAARLAAFLLAEEERAGDSLPEALRLIGICIYNPGESSPDDGPDDLYIVNQLRKKAYPWRPPGIDPAPGRLTDAEQWKLYRERALKELAEAK
jgi:hypothetical protein